MEKKGFWNSLLRKKENTEDPKESLKKQGIDVLLPELSLDEIKEKGYRRMDSNEIDHFNGLFQYVPQILAGNAHNQNVGKAFNSAVEGSFRVKLDPGTHLATLKANPEAFLGAELKNANNQVAGQAKWFKNDAALNVPSTPQIALGVFNALSFATGQYFMSEINGKLSTIKAGVDRIERFLNNAQQSEVKAACKIMKDLLDRAEFILRDPKQRVTTVEQINKIQEAAQKSIEFCHDQIMDELACLNKQDKDDEIKRKIYAIGNYLEQYFVSVRLYGLATLMEVQLNQIYDLKEINAFRRQVEERIHLFIKDFKECRSKVDKYLDENHALNDLTGWQNAAMYGTFGASSAIGGLIGNVSSGISFGGKLAQKVGKHFSYKHKKMKAIREIQAQEQIESRLDEEKLVESLRLFDAYERMNTQTVEFLRVGEEYYTDMPKYAMVEEPEDG